MHIITCEDPIEFLHTHQRAHRQPARGRRGHDQLRLGAASASLREDPDVILVGEMRDLETIQMALTAAETGHLVFAHPAHPVGTADRGPHRRRVPARAAGPDPGDARRHAAGRRHPAAARRAKDGAGRAAAVEVLIATPAVRNLIREGKGYQMATQMQAGAKYGMVTMDQSLAELVKAGRITFETGRSSAPPTPT